MTLQSIEDLKTKFLQDHNPGELISIPVVKLQNYNSVPVHLLLQERLALEAIQANAPIAVLYSLNPIPILEKVWF